MSERIKLGLSLVNLWGIYGSKRVEYEVKKKRIKRLSSSNLATISQLGGSLEDGQKSLIDASDALAKRLSQADLSSAEGMKQFVEDFPEQVPGTQSLSVIQRRVELIQRGTKEAGELMDEYGRQLVEVTKMFIKSLF